MNNVIKDRINEALSRGLTNRRSYVEVRVDDLAAVMRDARSVAPAPPSGVTPLIHVNPSVLSMLRGESVSRPGGITFSLAEPVGGWTVPLYEQHVVAQLQALSVTRIMLDIVPGDGDGHEVYAKSVAEVERKLGDLYEKLEATETERDGLKAQVEQLTQWQAISVDDLSEAEHWINGHAGKAAFFPADANTLADYAMHCIREVRATRPELIRALKLVRWLYTHANVHQVGTVVMDEARQFIAQHSKPAVCATPTGKACPGDGVNECRRCPSVSSAKISGETKQEAIEKHFGSFGDGE